MNIVTTSGEVCYYCTYIQKAVPDYPVNPFVDKSDDFTPRCSVHNKFICSFCNVPRHFSSIAWCVACLKFSCIYCNPYEKVGERFLIYPYYYAIYCPKCGTMNPALDYAELKGMHPYQLGHLRPSEGTNVWLPFFTDDIEPQTYTGYGRLLQLMKKTDAEPICNYFPLVSSPEKFKLDPTERVLYLNLEKVKQISDFKVHQIPIEQFTSVEEDRYQLDFDLLHAKIHLETLKFNRVIVDRVISFVDDLPRFWKIIRDHVEPDCSIDIIIDHPIKGRFTTSTLALPRDSDREEDQLIAFLRNPIAYDRCEKSQFKYMTHSLSEIINPIIDAGFILSRVEETEVKGNEVLMLFAYLA